MYCRCNELFYHSENFPNLSVRQIDGSNEELNARNAFFCFSNSLLSCARVSKRRHVPERRHTALLRCLGCLTCSIPRSFSAQFLCTCVPAGVPGEAGRGHISIRDFAAAQRCQWGFSSSLRTLGFHHVMLRVFCFAFAPSLLLRMNFQAGWRLPQLRSATWKREVYGIKSVWTQGC